MIAVVIACITFIVSVFTKIIDFSEHAKKVSNVSLSLYVLTFVSYCLWAIHGVLKNDVALIYGQGFGILTTGIIVGQLLYYRKRAQ